MGKRTNKLEKQELCTNCKYLPLARDFFMLITLAMTIILAQQNFRIIITSFNYVTTANVKGKLNSAQKEDIGSVTSSQTLYCVLGISEIVKGGLMGGKARRRKMELN